MTRDRACKSNDKWSVSNGVFPIARLNRNGTGAFAQQPYRLLVKLAPEPSSLALFHMNQRVQFCEKISVGKQYGVAATELIASSRLTLT